MKTGLLNREITATIKKKKTGNPLDSSSMRGKKEKTGISTDTEGIKTS